MVEVRPVECCAGAAARILTPAVDKYEVCREAEHLHECTGGCVRKSFDDARIDRSGKNFVLITVKLDVIEPDAPDGFIDSIFFGIHEHTGLFDTRTPFAGNFLSFPDRHPAAAVSEQKSDHIRAALLSRFCRFHRLYSADL